MFIQTSIFFLLTLPFATALAGTLVLFCHHKNSMAKKLLTLLATSSTIYYLSDALFVFSGAEKHLIIIAEIIGQFMAPFSLALSITFFYCAYNNKKLPAVQYLWFVVPFVFGILCIVLLSMIGFEEAAQCRELTDRLRHLPEQYASQPIFALHEIIVTFYYNIALAIYVLISITYALIILHRTGFRFWKLNNYHWKYKHMNALQTLSLAFSGMMIVIASRVVLGRYFLQDHIILNILFSLLQAYCIIRIIIAGLKFTTTKTVINKI